MRPLLAAATAALAIAPTALAGQATLVARDVPLVPGRAPASVTPAPFNLVGLHWRGPGEVLFRTRAGSSPWSAWRRGAAEAEDRPDTGTREASWRAGWQLGSPYWTGTADRIQYRLRGRVSRLRAHFVWSPVESVPMRGLSIAGSPQILRRATWSASERIRRGTPSYARSVRFAVVHHTAGSNAYEPAQSSAIVRAIQLYHVQANGWNDIGYNFLVDKFGQVFEGRYGGVARNVVGAHAQGFNTGSVGVSLIGNYGSASISAQATAALVRLLSWRLDLAHVDPGSTLTWASSGNPRFPPGSPVFLRTVSGHRDTGPTSCPGDAVYRRLSSIGATVRGTGLPKLYSPSAQGSVGQRIRFRARLSSSLPWTVTVWDTLGQRVAGGSALSAAVDWTWDARTVARRVYTYAIAAGAAVRPATGSIGGSAPPPPTPPATLLAQVRASPATVTPNGDGAQDTTTVSYVLAAPAVVTATIADTAGATVASLFSERREAGSRSFRLIADSFPDGAYRVVLSAVSDDGTQVTAEAAILVSRLLRALAPVRPSFSPNADGRFDRMRFRFELLGPAEVRLRITKAGISVTTPFAGELVAGLQELDWDGSKSGGRLLDGRYSATLTVTDATASVSQSVVFTSDTVAPRLTWRGGLRVSVSEPATVTASRGASRSTITLERAGTFLVPRVSGSGRLRVSVADAAGNIGRPLTLP